MERRGYKSRPSSGDDAQLGPKERERGAMRVYLLAVLVLGGGACGKISLENASSDLARVIKVV